MHKQTLNMTRPGSRPELKPQSETVCVQVEVHNLSLVIALDKALPTGSEAGNHAPGPPEGMGSRLQLRIRALTMHNACTEAYGVLATDVGVKGVSLDIEQPPQLPPSFPGSCRPTRGAVACFGLHVKGVRSTILKPCLTCMPLGGTSPDDVKQRSRPATDS